MQVQIHRPGSCVSILRHSAAATAWVGLALHDDQAHLARVSTPAEGRPRVDWVDSQAWRPGHTGWRGLRRQHRLQQERLVAVLPDGHYQLVSLPAPDVPRADWADALRWQLRDVVDFAVDTAAVDVLAVPGADPEAPARTVLAVAADAARVQPLVDRCDDFRLPLAAIDIAETSLRNLCALRGDDHRGRALLRLQARRSDLVLTLKGELLMSRHFELGTERLGATDPERRQAALDQLALEVQRTLDLCERLFSHANVADLVLLPDPLAEALAADLREVVYLPVLVLPLGELLDLSQAPALADAAGQARYALAIGAALRPAPQGQ
jgi:MSHA biogenesis protein MshI